MVLSPYAQKSSLANNEAASIGNSLTKQLLVLAGISALIIGASFLAKKKA